jgi:hypothetical protein
MRRQCDYPGCSEVTKRRWKSVGINKDGWYQGHGVCHRYWMVCPEHKPYVPFTYVKRIECVICEADEKLRRNRIQAEVNADLQTEADRRNAEERRLSPGDYSSYLKEYRAQGYGVQAAEALAAKRQRTNPRKHWSVADVAKERERVEHLRLRQAGLLGQCSKCRQWVQASEWVILAHLRQISSNPEEGWGTCPGEGEIVIRYTGPAN